MEQTLLVLAAGLSTRYGGLKQLEPVGPRGETLLDYAVVDAAKAGVSRVVCVVRAEIQRDMERHVAAGVGDVLPVEFLVQDPSLEVDPRYAKPRANPWGTAHAVLSAADHIEGPFVSVNADDFYGPGSYQALHMHLARAGDHPVPEFAMVGFTLEDTLSPFGGVSRGICQTNTHGYLEELLEVTQVVAVDDTSISGVTNSGTVVRLTGREIASMNIWGFTSSVFGMLREEFVQFQRRYGDHPDVEFLISGAVNTLVGRGAARLKVLPSEDQWLGITHPDDQAFVRERLRRLATRGVYPDPLYPRKDG